MPIYFIEALVYIGYSFLAPIITAGGGILVSNVLSLADINLIKAAGLTSMYFAANGLIVISVFRKDIVWADVKRLIPLALIGAFIGATLLVNITPVILLSLMFFFSLYFIYQKSTQRGPKIHKDSIWKEQGVAVFSGLLIGTALPGGGFINAYLLSRGFSIPQMYSTMNFILFFLFLTKIATLFSAGILIPSDIVGVAIAFPFLIISNYYLRRGLIKLPKKVTDVITIIAMCLVAIYAAVIILGAIL